MTKNERRCVKLVCEITNEPSIRCVVTELNAICRKATLDFALLVGACIVKNVYEGDLNRFRSRDRHKEQTLRTIATHPNLRMSAGTVYRSVATYELCERMGIQSWHHVSLSHIRLVLPLTIEDQARLLQKAEGDGWSVQRLDEEVAALMRTERPPRTRGGRRRSSPLSRTLRIVDQATERLSELLDSSEDFAAGLSPEGTQTAVDSLHRAAQACERLRHRLELTLCGAVTVRPPAPSPIGLARAPRARAVSE